MSFKIHPLAVSRSSFVSLSHVLCANGSAKTISGIIENRNMLPLIFPDFRVVAQIKKGSIPTEPYRFIAGIGPFLKLYRMNRLQTANSFLFAY
ncbi:MAG: hypothetical protein PWP30_2302 [Eubacteriaceae bacterium]|jgi:hypothetical protein|nr:hypothetical protein [Eubacteriaceae bacterium]